MKHWVHTMFFLTFFCGLAYKIFGFIFVLLKVMRQLLQKKKVFWFSQTFTFLELHLCASQVQILRASKIITFDVGIYFAGFFLYICTFYILNYLGIKLKIKTHHYKNHALLMKMDNAIF